VTLTLEALRSDAFDTVLACFPDMQGRLIGKRFQAGYFVEAAHQETHACDYLLANDLEMEPVPGYEFANWAKGYGDFVLKPDLATLRRVPWLEGTALVLCEVVDHHGDPVPVSPRAILQRQIERLASLGMTAFVASELEFYVFDEDYRTLHERRYAAPKTSGYYIQDYHILQTSKEEALLRAMRNGLEGAGIPVECTKGEWGPGQEEINVRYCDALAMADRHVILKNGLKEIAHQHGKAITFMAKWNNRVAGSSCHVHLSLRDAAGQRPLFPDKDGRHGMSQTMQAFLAGQLEHARAITYFLAPYVNSYKRFQAGTFAPTKLVWSRDNRTAAFRLVGEQTEAVRIECRLGGADLNPYLAFAALIAAGLDGLERKLELGEPHAGDAYSDVALPSAPLNLRTAADAMRGSQMLREAFGAGVVDHYAHAADWEQSQSDQAVTDWDLVRGFERA
jgi:glutamine synthetase